MTDTKEIETWLVQAARFAEAEQPTAALDRAVHALRAAEQGGAKDLVARAREDVLRYETLAKAWRSAVELRRERQVTRERAQTGYGPPDSD